jgi:hypothetical protein
LRAFERHRRESIHDESLSSLREVACERRWISCCGRQRLCVQSCLRPRHVDERCVRIHPSEARRRTRTHLRTLARSALRGTGALSCRGVGACGWGRLCLADDARPPPARVEDPATLLRVFDRVCALRQRRDARAYPDLSPTRRSEQRHSSVGDARCSRLGFATPDPRTIAARPELERGTLPLAEPEVART